MTAPAVEPHIEDLARQVERLSAAIPAGPALLVGGELVVAEQLLAPSLKELKIVVFSPEELVKCHAGTAAAGCAVEVVDAAAARFAPRSYAVAVVAALARFTPPVGDRLLDQAAQAVWPGGLLFVAAPTIDDAEAERLRALGPPVERHTYRGPDGRLVRFVVPGELSLALGGWSVILAVHRRAPAAGDTPRCWAIVAARRSPAGTLLA